MDLRRAAVTSELSQKVVLTILYICVHCHAIYFNSLDSSVRILTGCRLDDRGSIRIRGKIFFCSP
jgi:hypothetical protein